jgi:hypothetical protein
MASHNQALPFNANDYGHSQNKKTRLQNPSFSASAFEKSLFRYATDPDFCAVKNTISGLGNLVESLAAVRETPDPTKPRAAVALEYVKTLEKVKKTAETNLKNAAYKLQAAQDKATCEMFSKTKLNFVTSRAAEIRATFRQLDETQRQDFLNRSVESGNGEILAAVLDAPAELSMLPESVISRARDTFIASHAPEYLQTVEALDTAQRRLELAYDAFLQETDNLRDRGIEEFAENGQNAAREANKALELLIV